MSLDVGFLGAEATLHFLPPFHMNAKINQQLNFYLETQDISAMTKCPRCNIEQKEAAQCEYCGLVFEAFRDSTQASKTARPKRTVLFAIILVVAGALLASYLLISYQDKPDQKSPGVERSSKLAHRPKENDLKTTARELSGDVGILKDFTGGNTKSSIIAMVIFSVIGLGYLTYGKKSQQLLMLICGMALMGYSYLVDGTMNIIVIGVGLSAIPFIFGRK